MAAANRDQSHPGQVAVHSDQPSDTAGGISKSEKPTGIPPRTSIPPQTSGPGNAPPVTPRPLPAEPPKAGGEPGRRRFLSPIEWARIAHGIGAIREAEALQVVQPSCWYWPPKGLPEGLYRDVVEQRWKYSILYLMASTLQLSLMALQIIIGAVLTALGSLELRSTNPVTALAAVNTVDAGVLALLHKSGLPGRYRNDKVEFERVKDFLKVSPPSYLIVSGQPTTSCLQELLDTGIVDANQTDDDIVDDCFARFQRAKSTVLANKSETYTPAPSAGGVNPVLAPAPAVHVPSGRS